MTETYYVMRGKDIDRWRDAQVFLFPFNYSIAGADAVLFFFFIFMYSETFDKYFSSNMFLFSASHVTVYFRYSYLLWIIEMIALLFIWLKKVEQQIQRKKSLSIFPYQIFITIGGPSRGSSNKHSTFIYAFCFLMDIRSLWTKLFVLIPSS